MIKIRDLVKGEGQHDVNDYVSSGYNHRTDTYERRYGTITKAEKGYSEIMLRIYKEDGINPLMAIYPEYYEIKWDTGIIEGGFLGHGFRKEKNVRRSN